MSKKLNRIKLADQGRLTLSAAAKLLGLTTGQIYQRVYGGVFVTYQKGLGIELTEVMRMSGDHYDQDETEMDIVIND